MYTEAVITVKSAVNYSFCLKRYANKVNTELTSLVGLLCLSLTCILLNSKLNGQMCFSLLSIKCSVAQFLASAYWQALFSLSELCSAI